MHLSDWPEKKEFYCYMASCRLSSFMATEHRFMAVHSEVGARISRMAQKAAIVPVFFTASLHLLHIPDR